MKNTLIAVLAVVVIGLGAYTIIQKKAVTPALEEQQQARVAGSHCGLTINSPLTGSTVTFPLTINAMVDNTAATTLGCSWGVFEANAGSVVIKDTNGNVLAQSYLATTANWMTVNPTVYNATIPSLSNPSYTGALTIMFTEDNSADIPNPDTLSIQVVK